MLYKQGFLFSFINKEKSFMGRIIIVRRCDPMRYGKFLAGVLLGAVLLAPAAAGQAYDPADEIVSVVEGDEETEAALKAEQEMESQQYKKPASEARRPSDNSRADEWFERPEDETSGQERDEKGKPVKGRYLKIIQDESGFTYYLDTQTAKWRYLPYSASEKIIDVWVKLVQEGAGEFSSEEDYSYPQTYFLEHYYIRPDRQQIQFLCELEVTGRPQNAIKERDYSPANWEGLVPGSVEDEVYRVTVDYLKRSKKAGMTRHGKNLTARDALEEFLRISL